MRTTDLTTPQVAASFAARDVNRRIVFNLVRARPSISSADLVRESGVQRKTVSVIHPSEPDTPRVFKAKIAGSITSFL